MLKLGKWTAYSSGAPELSPGFLWGSCCLNSFLCSVLSTIACLFVAFRLAIDLIDLIFGVLTPISAIFQLYHGDQF